MRNIFNLNHKQNLRETLKRLEIPLDLVMFYSPTIIKKMGTKLVSNKDFYALNQFIFKITNDSIQKVYYNIEFLQKNPQLLK